MEAKPLWALKDVRRFMGIGRTVLYELRKRNDFPKPIRIGTSLRFCPDEILAWVESQRERDS